MSDDSEYAERDREAAERQRIRDEALAEYLKLPPIKRIEHWYAATNSGVEIGQAFQILGRALEEWAKEQQKRD